MVKKRKTEIVDKKLLSKRNKTLWGKFSESYISLFLGMAVVFVVFIGILFFGKAKTVPSDFDKINTAASTSIEFEKKLETPNASIRTYEVKTGDDLWSISEKIYGSGYNWVDLAKENNLGNPGNIFVGTKLKLLNVEPKLVVSETLRDTQMIQRKNSIMGTTYIVQTGDYLWDISVRAYGDGYKWSEIAKVNNIENPDLIYSGNSLKLPR